MAQLHATPSLVSMNESDVVDSRGLRFQQLQESLVAFPSTSLSAFSTCSLCIQTPLGQAQVCFSTN